MGSGLQVVADATAAVFIEGRRVGSAVLVDGQHLLTAGHVLSQAEQVQVRFPSGSAACADLPATRLALPADVSTDVAVLDLGEQPPPHLPRSVAVWPARRLPRQISVLGFPTAEKQASGVWRQFEVVGPVAGGRVQLDWTRDVGTLPGHSGGPVVAADPDEEPTAGAAALVGVLVEGSSQGRFDRFVPVTVIAQCWAGLPRAWLMAGAQARSHFHRRARGQRSRARGGDLFRGRHEALAAAQGWLSRAEAPGQPLVVTGQPGAGKSSVVARAVLALEAAGIGPGLAFHARGATHSDLLEAVADLTGYYGELTQDALLEALAEVVAPEPRAWLIVCDGLDEAANPIDRQRIAETLTELALLPAVRVAVATRPLAVSNRYAHGALLPTLGVSSWDNDALVDLDTDRYFDPEGLQHFIAALLAQEGVERPGPAGAAWTAYRADPALCQRMATVVAGRADRNYLVAVMAAAPLSAAPHPADPATADFDPQSIPSGVGEALGKYLDQLSEDRRTRVRGLLTALAYARGDGIDDRLWLRFADALGYPTTIPELDQLRDSGVADYLLQIVPDTAGPVTRLFHQALSDELLACRHRPTDERALLGELRASSTGWASAPRYLKQHAADHAAAAGQLETLLGDVDYLAVAGGLNRASTPCGLCGPPAAVSRRTGCGSTSMIS